MVRRVLDALAYRPGTIALAVTFVLLGLYPGPELVLLLDPAWRTHPLERQLADERAFWATGFVFVVAPSIALANVLRGRFDRAWAVVRAVLGAVSERWFVYGAAIVAVIAAAVAATYVLAGKPTTSDEVAQLWHARMLLTGRLSLPPDANPEFFAVDNVIDAGRWYSQFPIGGPAAFAVAMLLGVTWLLNPLLAGLTVVNVYRFASRAYGTGEARVAAVLCATCPFLLWMSGSYMNHTLVAFLVTLALAELPAWDDVTDRVRMRRSVVIGLALGAAVTVRPLDGAIAAIALGGFLVQSAVRHGRVRALLVTAAAGAVPIAWLLVTNWLTTGRPLLFGYEALWGANHGLGFHTDPLGNHHTPGRGLLLAMVYMVQLNWALFEWPIAGLLVVGGALVAIGRLGRWEVMFILWIEAQLIAYAAYWHAGYFLGPRYLLTVVPAFLLIVARGIVRAERSTFPIVRRTVVAGVAASILGSWLIPSKSAGALGSARAARPLRTAFKMDLDPVVKSLDGSKALVFVAETASTRLARRLWGLGITRPDAARLMLDKDNCALLDAARDEAKRDDSPANRLVRLERVENYAPLAARAPQVPDATFRISNDSSMTPFCRADVMLDAERGQSISYGLALLQNEIGPDGQIAGPIVFVADLGERNELLRGRFGDRRWYRLAPPDGAAARVPRLIPYE